MTEKGGPLIITPLEATAPEFGKRLVRANISSEFKPKTVQSDEKGEAFTPT